MKKILSVALCLIMLFCCAAVAEEAAPEAVYDPAAIESMFEGRWVLFDDGVRLYVPVGWNEAELTEAQMAVGLYFGLVSPDDAYRFSLAWAPLEENIALEDAIAEMSAAYPGANVTNNGVLDIICYADAETDSLGYMVLDPVEPGVYTLNFTPLSDADFVALSAVIASSWNIVPVEAEAAA